MRLCFKCKCVIPNERIDVLPDTQTCVQCSGVEKYVGAMIFDHKTAGRLEYVNPIDATILKRWRGEESPSVYGGEDVKVSPTSGFTPKKLLNLAA